MTRYTIPTGMTFDDFVEMFMPPATLLARNRIQGITPKERAWQLLVLEFLADAERENVSRETIQPELLRDTPRGY